MLDTNRAAETDKEIDLLVDQKLRQLGEEEDKLVIDPRLAWHWIPQSFKVYLDLDLNEAAERIINDMSEERRQAEHIPNEPDAYAKMLAERLASESKRYLNLYQQNPYQTENYDLVVDTKANNVEAVIDLIETAFTTWLKK